jgi:spore germination protein
MKWKGRIQKKGVAVMLGALAAALLIVSLVMQQRVSALTTQVNAAYQKAFYETIELMGGIQINLEKLMVTSSGAQEQSLLTTVARQAEGVSGNLSQMPQGDSTLEGSLKFVNQVSDYARVLSERLGSGGALTGRDYEQLNDLHTASVSLNRQLIELMIKYDAGEPIFGEGSVTLSAVPESAEGGPVVDYPVLLYDGPFSDARTDQSIALAGNEFSKEQATEALAAFIGSERVAKMDYAGESQILSSCYEFSAVLKDDTTLTAGVTKMGGHVVYMLPDQAPDEAKLSEGDCIDQGIRFLSAHGYENMEVNYWRRLENILTVNYAATQGDVLLYPDLIKLQISMKDGLVIGVEAVNYLQNHRVRTLQQPLISEEDARARVNQALTIGRVRQCIIPLDEGEVQCWEISATLSNDEQYLIYIDSMTGIEKTILRVMQDDEGILTQ